MSYLALVCELIVFNFQVQMLCYNEVLFAHNQSIYLSLITLYDMGYDRYAVINTLYFTFILIVVSNSVGLYTHTT